MRFRLRRSRPVVNPPEVPEAPEWTAPRENVPHAEQTGLYLAPGADAEQVVVGWNVLPDTMLSRPVMERIWEYYKPETITVDGDLTEVFWQAYGYLVATFQTSSHTQIRYNLRHHPGKLDDVGRDHAREYLLLCDNPAVLNGHA